MKARLDSSFGKREGLGHLSSAVPEVVTQGHQRAVSGIQAFEGMPELNVALEGGT